MLENALFFINTSAFFIWFVGMESASLSALKSAIMLQKRAIRNINRAKYRAHAEPLFKSSLILKLTDLYEYQVTLSMFYFIANKLPISFHNTFKFNRDIENARITRLDGGYLIYCM